LCVCPAGWFSGIRVQAGILLYEDSLLVNQLWLCKVGRQIASWYWSGTEYANNPDNAWNFNMNNGNQNNTNKNNNGYGLAVRSG